MCWQYSLGMKVKVEYKGVPYHPVSYTLAFNNGVKLHTATLKDLRANSVIVCSLDEVKQIT